MVTLNARGYAHLLIIGVIIVIGGIGFTSYRILSSNKDARLEKPNVNDENDQLNAGAVASDPLPASNAENHTESTVKLSSESVPNESSGTGGSTSTGGTSSGGGSGGASGGTEDGDEGTQPQTKTFDINSYSFGYSLNTLHVSPGDIVTIHLTNSGGKHDWVIDEINGAATNIINGGQTDSITFTVPPSAAGKTYNFYCSVGNHRALGMEGNFVVSS